MYFNVFCYPLPATTRTPWRFHGSDVGQYLYQDVATKAVASEQKKKKCFWAHLIETGVWEIYNGHTIIVVQKTRQ